MTNWIHVPDKNKFGVAIHNYKEEGPYRINLTVGESVHILQENGEWFFGYSTKNKSVRGIFPKCYIHFKECKVDRSGTVEIITLNQPAIIQEITSVLREWGQIWKHLYMSHSSDFEEIGRRINELLGFRSKILSGTLPVDELKEIKQLATSKIDLGNKILDLDMVVRDDQGNILNPEETSTIQLYWQHETASERIRQAKSASTKKIPKPVTQYSHIFFVSVRNFVCKMSEDAQLLMSLYDAREGRSITEYYVITWSKEGLARDIDQLHNLRVLFTDLGSRDLTREKVYFVCYVVRLGTMECRDLESNSSSRRTSQVNFRLSHTIRSSHSTSSSSKPDWLLRRPFGVAAMDITLYLNGKIESDEEKHNFIPFVQCTERDNLEGTLKRILTIKDFSQKDHKGQGLWTSMKLLHGDIKQVREENPHLVLGNVAIARKMGFPEVILPGDVRNDLYLTLHSGEFPKGSKSADKNVEVTVRVCNDKGHVLPGVIMLGGSTEPLSEYRSLVYYHECRPAWCEIFKVEVPIDQFKCSHIRFTFKHRSSNESKDRAEKPFAFAYVKLMQHNGTTLRDSHHDLLVYKVDHKKWEDLDLGYLQLPSTRQELTEGSSKPQHGGLTLSSKDSFTILTNVCSTKLTQNVDLLGLLNWSSNPEGLKNSLAALMKVDGEEVVKFLQDVLDALFNILMQNSDSDLYDNMVFECLLYIIGLVSDRKYQHFQPVLDLYIQESFSATLAYNKLIVVLKYHIDNANSNDQQDKDLLLKTMKGLQYCTRFIVRSRILYAELNEDRDRLPFEDSLKELLLSIISMMSHSTDVTLLVQGACLKYLPSTIPDILRVFNPIELSKLLAELIHNVPENRLTKQKMMTVNDFVHSQLFLSSECRRVLLPCIMGLVKKLLEARDETRVGIEFRNKSKSVAKIAKVLGASQANLQPDRGYSEELELCVKILSDVMDLIFRKDVGPTIHDITCIILTVLRTVIQTPIAMDRETPIVGNLVAINLSIFRQMTPFHFEEYIKHFVTRTDLLDFLMEILLVFKDLVSRPVYPRDWSEMILLQNSVILNSLRFFSHTIRDYFSESFESQAWNNFFHCAIAFLTQPALQLETFSSTKRQRVIARYKDMRRETAFEIRSMWFNLGQHKMNFVPGLVGSILEMTLIPETELRRHTIPIFFDMMQCEFYSSRHSGDSISDTKRDSTLIKANFTEFENEMITKLDMLVEGGRGDEQYKELFFEIMMDYCEQHSTMRDQGVRFVKTVSRLMERLLEYRCIINDENKENRMSCTVNLLDFYNEINRKEMYIRYVNKLCDLHLECDNYTEAAFALKLHSKLLSWSDQSLTPILCSNKYPQCKTHRELKEALYYDVIHYFDKGKMWEFALEACKELGKEYEEQTYDYGQLSSLLNRMAQLYDKILKQRRHEPEYFRVAYYGRGFPAFLQNKVFIYRGKEYERLSDFSSRTLNALPNAELMNTLTLPKDEIKESMQQYVQINKVETVTDERKAVFKRAASEHILRYHRVNNVQKFRFSRPYYRRDPALAQEGQNGEANEFASLWLERTVLVTSYPLPGILRWFPVISTDTYNVSPLTNAIETMQSSNKELRELILAHYADPNLAPNPLTMKLNGIVDPAVMGGISKYEKAFFNPNYLEAHPEDLALNSRLKDLIASQIPLLEQAIALHRNRAPASLGPLQNHIEKCFAQLRDHVHTNYGKKISDLKLEGPQVTIRKQFYTVNSITDSRRLSEVSITSSEGSRSRVSSLTRSQVASLKTLAFFSPTSTIGRSPGSHSSAIISSGPNSIGTSSPGNMFSRSSNTVTLKSKREKNKEKRRSRKSDRESTTSSSLLASLPLNTSGTTQWYTSDTSDIGSPSTNSPSTATTPVFELRQELTPKRPLRSEVEREKRLSRPSSGQFRTGNGNGAGSNGGTLSSTLRFNGNNRDSIGTTDSTASEEDAIPPPLPAKLRSEGDYCNLPDTEISVQPPPSPTIQHVRDKPPPPEPIENTSEDIQPPTPPPKRPHIKLPFSPNI